MKKGISEMSKFPVRLQKAKIESFCKKYHLAYMAFFGSALTPHFKKKSDVDVLVKFEKKHIPHLRKIRTFVKFKNPQKSSS